MVTFNKEVLNMCNQGNNRNKAQFGTFGRILPLDILAGLRANVLCLRPVIQYSKCATGE